MTKASENPFPSVLLDHTSNTVIATPDVFETRFFADADGSPKLKDSAGTVTALGATAASSAISTHEGETDPHTGYVLESVIDAAHDIFVGSGDNAVTRKALGTSNTLLGSSNSTLAYVPVAVSAFAPDSLNASAAPSSTDDFAAGWRIGSRWVYNGTIYICTSETTGSATWQQVGSGSSSGGTLYTDLSVSGAYTMDRDNGETQDLTLTGDATITPDAGSLTGVAIDIRGIIRQDGVGGHTLTIAGTVTWAGGSAPTMPSGADEMMTVGLVSVDDGTTWLGYYDQVGTGLTNPMTTAGDIIYSSDGSGTPARLAAGTNGHVLTLASGVPSWAAVSGGSGITSGTDQGAAGSAGTLYFRTDLNLLIMDDGTRWVTVNEYVAAGNILTTGVTLRMFFSGRTDYSMWLTRSEIQLRLDGGGADWTIETQKVDFEKDFTSLHSYQLNSYTAGNVYMDAATLDAEYDCTGGNAANAGRGFSLLATENSGGSNCYCSAAVFYRLIIPDPA